MKNIKYKDKGVKIMNVPFTHDEMELINEEHARTLVSKKQIVRNFILSKEFLTVNK
jgi:hypothetical protein